MHQQWFEMSEIRKRKFDHAVWVPLRVIEFIKFAGAWASLDIQKNSSAWDRWPFPWRIRPQLNRSSMPQLALSALNAATFKMISTFQPTSLMTMM
jgi:hypothetical protein